MDIRKAKREDLDRIMEIYAHARTFMAATGNAGQWVDGYPQRELLAADIVSSRCYVMTGTEGQVAAVFCFMPGPDPTYATITDGAWPDDGPYHVIHRLASDGSSAGVTEACFSWCARQAGRLRADTHAENRIMQHLLEKYGFIRCGTIFVKNGTPRIAYQRNEL